MKRNSIIYKVLTALCVFVMVFAFSSCGNNNSSGTESVSSLRGKFTYADNIGASADKPLLIATKIPDSGISTNKDSLYFLSYPQNQSGASRVSYKIDQSLSLKKDFSYEYQYTITLTNPGEWGSDFAKFVVSISGIYSYESVNEEQYNVTLQDPTKGTETIYASNLLTQNNPSSIYSWGLHAQADAIIDIEVMSKTEGYELSDYVKGRTLSVNVTEKSVTDDLFYPLIMNDISKYSTY